MLPSVITGVGNTSREERFFISLQEITAVNTAVTGPKPGHKCHEEWFHLAVEIHEDNVVEAFINHASIGSLKVDYPTGPQLRIIGVSKSTCHPYNFPLGAISLRLSQLCRVREQHCFVRDEPGEPRGYRN